MRELPHEPADLTTASAAMAGRNDVASMKAGLAPVYDQRDRQAEREQAARANLEDAERALSVAQAAHQREAGDLRALNRTIVEGETAIEARRQDAIRERAVAEQRRKEHEAVRRREIEEGLRVLGRQAQA